MVGAHQTGPGIGIPASLGRREAVFRAIKYHLRGPESEARRGKFSEYPHSRGQQVPLLYVYNSTPDELARQEEPLKREEKNRDTQHPPQLQTAIRFALTHVAISPTGLKFRLHQRASRCAHWDG